MRSGAWCTPFWFGGRPFFRRIESAALPRLARVVGAWQPCCSGCPYMYRSEPMSFPTDQRAFDHASVDADDSKIPVPYHDHSRPANRGIISPFCATSWWEAPEWGQACDCSGKSSCFRHRCSVSLLNKISCQALSPPSAILTAATMQLNLTDSQIQLIDFPATTPDRWASGARSARRYSTH